MGVYFMAIVRKISSLMVVFALLAGLTSLDAAVSAQDRKKAAERKVKRTTKEQTKGKAKAAQSVMQPLAVKRTITAKKPVTEVITKGYVAPDITTLPAPMNAPSNRPLPASNTRYNRPLPAIPVVTEVAADMPPSDMPTKLSVALIAMLPSNLQNRVENIIVSYPADSQSMFKNIYLLAWVDDELMKKMNSSDFYSTFLTVISQECNVPYAVIETMAAPVKDSIDNMLTHFENAIVTGNKNNFDIQQVRNLFSGQDSYIEYLERCLRLANEYKQSNMVTVLKLAIANATANTGTPFMPNEEEDFNY
jgi:hypothetical protein